MSSKGIKHINSLKWSAVKNEINAIIDAEGSFGNGINWNI